MPFESLLARRSRCDFRAPYRLAMKPAIFAVAKLWRDYDRQGLGLDCKKKTIEKSVQICAQEQTVCNFVRIWPSIGMNVRRFENIANVAPSDRAPSLVRR